MHHCQRWDRCNRRGGDTRFANYHLDLLGWQSLHGETVMLKGCMIAALALLFLMLCDQQVSNGKYTDAVIVMAKHITRSFGV